MSLRRSQEYLRDYSRNLEADIKERRERIKRTEDKIRGLVDFIAQGDRSGDRSEYVVSTLRDLETYARAEKAMGDQLLSQAQEPLKLPSVDGVAALAFQLDARLNQDPQAGRSQLIRWLKDGKLRVTVGPYDKQYAKGEMLPLTILAEAENTKPADQLAGLAARRYTSFVAWAGFAGVSIEFVGSCAAGPVIGRPATASREMPSTTARSHARARNLPRRRRLRALDRAMSEAHAIEPELVTEPMSWVQICERYPDQWVALVEMDWDDETDEFTTRAWPATVPPARSRSHRCGVPGCATTRSATSSRAACARTRSTSCADGEGSPLRPGRRSDHRQGARVREARQPPAHARARHRRLAHAHHAGHRTRHENGRDDGEWRCARRPSPERPPASPARALLPVAPTGVVFDSVGSPDER